MKVDRDLDHLHPVFRLTVLALLDAMRARGFLGLVVETWRPAARAAELRAAGKSWSSWSFHEYVLPCACQGREGCDLCGDSDVIPAALAVDICEDVRSRGGAPATGWGDRLFFDALDEEARRLGAFTGHHWKRRDSAHIQAVHNEQLGHVRDGGRLDLSHLRPGA